MSLSLRQFLIAGGAAISKYGVRRATSGDIKHALSFVTRVTGIKPDYLIDLMFVENEDWSKCMYYSSHGEKSKYPGSVRNTILFTARARTQEKDKDFVIRDYEGAPRVRASTSITMDSGMKQLFKMAKFNENRHI